MRISPFDNQGRRQTSFAGVRGAAGRRVQRPRRDRRGRAAHRRVPPSGPGGQGVTRRTRRCASRTCRPASCLSCQNERSQIQNKASAMNVLQAKLLERRRRRSRPRWTPSRTAAAPGATRCGPTSCTRTRWSRTCARSSRSAPAGGARRRDRRLPGGRDPLAQAAGTDRLSHPAQPTRT
ncbi:peptide chain release factor-like protein [Streptomyces cirratus]